jgi:hypothetical protein
MSVAEAGENTRRIAMNPRYIVLVTTLALLGFSVSLPAAPPDKPCSPWPECKDDDPEPPPDSLYTVILSGGPFQFVYDDVFVNSKGNLKSSTGLPLFLLPDDNGAWDEVFENCAGDFASAPEQISVGPNDWGVGKNSDANIHIDIEDIILEEGGVRKEIQIHLRGVPGNQFLPVCDPGEPEEQEFTLDYYTIWGKAWSGPGRKWNTCYHSDGQGVVIPEGTAFPDSVLIISIDCGE